MIQRSRTEKTGTTDGSSLAPSSPLVIRAHSLSRLHEHGKRPDTQKVHEPAGKRERMSSREPIGEDSLVGRGLPADLRERGPSVMGECFMDRVHRPARLRYCQMRQHED